MPRADAQEKLPEAKEAQKELKATKTVADVKAIFKARYGSLGWKCLCRLWVLEQTPEQSLGIK